jgi:hypothetical protein
MLWLAGGVALGLLLALGLTRTPPPAEPVRPVTEAAPADDRALWHRLREDALRR